MSLRQRLWTTFAFVLAITLVSGWINWPGSHTWLNRDVSLKQGLDLRGGAYLVYEADTSKLGDGSSVSDALDSTRSVFESRVNALGVTEPEIRTGTSGGKPAIIVSLPGIQDLAQAKELLGSTAKLEFRDESGALVLEGSDIVPKKTMAQPATSGNASGLGSATEWQVILELTPEGKEKFATATTANIGKQIGIFLDDTVISAPRVNDAITGGTATISGGFSAESARQLALQLKSGALPVPVSLVQEQTVGATLGKDAIDRSMVAAVLAIILVAIFMTLYYKWCGVLASLALIVYISLNVAIFRLTGVVLTLAGIAGFIISIGVSVDTNILTFERLKEELRLNKPLAVAVQESFRRSWSSIRDSHISALISAVVIFSFASGSVRGFALVLIIGTLLSLFSAITVTRNWMMLIAGSRLQKILKP